MILDLRKTQQENLHMICKTIPTLENNGMCSAKIENGRNKNDKMTNKKEIKENLQKQREVLISGLKQQGGLIPSR